MKAKEMFEKLEYDQTITQYGIWYLDINDNGFYFGFRDTHFVLHSKSTITLEELQAINKQVEELGWNK